MKRSLPLRLPGCLLSLTVFLVAGAAQAQGFPDAARLKEAFQKQQQTNEQALRQYTWKSRTEVRVGGEVKSTVLQMVRYGADGELQKTVIGGGKPRERTRLLQKTPIGALVSGIKQRKTEEFQHDLGKLLDTYANLSTERMQSFTRNVAFQPGQDEMRGTVRIFASDVVKSGDTLSIWIDPQTREKRKLEVLTSLHGDPVQIVTQFGKLADGVSFPSLTTVEVKARDLRIVTENFEFARQYMLETKRS